MIIVESDGVYQVTIGNYKIDEWANVQEYPIQYWKEYCYSPNMSDLSEHLTFSLLHVHQLRMNYVFQDVNFRVYYIYHGKFAGPFPAKFPVTFFADRLIYSGIAFSIRKDGEVIVAYNYEGNKTKM